MIPLRFKLVVKETGWLQPCCTARGFDKLERVATYVRLAAGLRSLSLWQRGFGHVSGKGRHQPGEMSFP
jgi:hypothetical protein